MPSILAGACSAEVVLQLLGLGKPEAKLDASSWLGGLMLRVPSSGKDRAAWHGFAKMDIKGQSDWKAV